MVAVKRYIKGKIQLFTLTAIKELTYRSFDQVGPANWKKLVEHANWEKLVEHVEQAFEDKYRRDKKSV